MSSLTTCLKQSTTYDQFHGCFVGNKTRQSCSQTAIEVDDEDITPNTAAENCYCKTKEEGSYQLFGKKSLAPTPAGSKCIISCLTCLPGSKSYSVVGGKVVAFSAGGSVGLRR